MIRRVICAKHRPGMSRAEFQDYWLNHHGPLFGRFVVPPAFQSSHRKAEAAAFMASGCQGGPSL